MANSFLPVPIEAPARRLDPLPERTLYAARAGLGALPSGFATVLVFMVPQMLSLAFVFWAIWWPYPETSRDYARALGCTGLVGAALLLVLWLLLRRSPGFVQAVLRAPFIRLTLTDRRLIWSLPWRADPLIEIARWRMVRGVLGTVDSRGRGNCAIELLPGDPMADADGHVHFDRLPAARAFLEALEAR